ncbi:MAG: hypothetical protein ABI649_00595 [Gaiellaceae bacterium]
MASQLRLQVLLPVAVLAILGLGVGAFAMSKGPATSDADAIAARIAARNNPTATTPAKPKPPAAKPKPSPSKPGLTPLQLALRQKPVAVVLFYKPQAAYDAIQTRETRAGALAAGAAFVAINVTRNSEVGKLATEYNVLEAPTVLVFRRGPVLKARFDGFQDRTTIIQAVRNASR